MTTEHPDLAEEQEFIDHAYDCLERSRQDAWKLHDLHEGTLGGTMQARYERDVFAEATYHRLTELDLGDAALVFGRIDRFAEPRNRATGNGATGNGAPGTSAMGNGTLGTVHDAAGIESFHIGRLAVADENSDPVVIDWRAPVAEPFYRATGRDTMNLARRRHFQVQGRKLLGLEDELFGEGHLGVDTEGVEGHRPRLRGHSTLLAAIERGRTGQLGDIVATIQAEQDEIIRSPQGGVLVVQGGPGTGKTVVALHRAAYLLYTHRFPLEDQGVLVVGPNRVFLRYIERVLPSLGEAGVEQVVLADLVPGVQWARTAEGSAEPIEVAAVKGDVRMADVLARAIRDRQRPLRSALRVPFRSGYVELSVAESQRIVRTASRRYRHHNQARRWVESEVFSSMLDGWRGHPVTTADLREAIRPLPEVRAALESMWPVLTPAQLLHDLFGSKALLRLAASRILAEGEYLGLYRPRSTSVEEVRFTDADVALLDEARELLGVANAKRAEAEEIRTYGHLVVDEVQDLTPMQLRMLSRRSLNGSMTIVGDIAQATGPLAPDSWDDVIAHLPSKRSARVVGLSVGYRIPTQIMDLATRVMRAATPTLRVPLSVRQGDAAPRIVATTEAGRDATVAEEARRLVAELADGHVAVVCPDPMVESVCAALTELGVAYGRATRHGLDMGVTVVGVSMVKGLELDGVVVVEPADIVADEHQGLRGLYVALTRSTRRLTVVHARPLPPSMS